MIQGDMNVKNLEHELHELLTNEQRVSQLKKDYIDLKNLLSQQGNASAKAAQHIYDFTSGK